jgi:hypothetical protein
MGPERSKFKIVGMTILIALTLSLVPAAVAQAEFEWNVEGQPLSVLGGEEEVEGSGGPFSLELESGEVSFDCEEQTTSGSITEGGNGVVTLQFTECVTNLPSCKITKPITANTKAEILELNGGTYVVFKPVSGTKFATLVISGCLFAGEYTIEGTVAAEPGGEEVEYPLTFSRAISEAAETELTLLETVYLEGPSELELAGPQKAKKVAAAPISALPITIKYPKIKSGETGKDIATIKNLHKTANLKYGLAQITGGAGAFSKETDECSNKEKGPGVECNIVVKFAPTKAKEEYGGLLILPWEDATGDPYGFVYVFLQGETE